MPVIASKWLSILEKMDLAKGRPLLVSPDPLLCEPRGARRTAPDWIWLTVFETSGHVTRWVYMLTFGWSILTLAISYLLLRPSLLSRHSNIHTSIRNKARTISGHHAIRASRFQVPSCDMSLHPGVIRVNLIVLTLPVSVE